MKLSGLPFDVVDWAQVSPVEHPGDAGKAIWRTHTVGDVRVRMVDYTPGYVADHWCLKGHIVLCVEGELHSDLADGTTHVLKPGMGYHAADNSVAHRSRAPNGARLFIVD